MRAPARHAAHAAFDSDDDPYAIDDFFPGERICPPAATGGNAMLRGYAVIFLVLGGGSAMLTKQADWQGWMSSATAAVSSLIPPPSQAIAPASPSGNEQQTYEPPPATPQPIDTKEVADAPGATAEASAAETTTAAVPSSDEAAAPLPPPAVDRSNPYQVQAAAAGLHPELSEVLLKHLSAADYRNAGIAIRTALAETPDDAVFVWPRQRTRQLALFKVHFVKGAAADCRRYVVTVTKDGWTTTALPMERCGSGLAGAQRKRAATG